MFDSSAQSAAPAPDATVVRTGRRGLAFALLIIVPFVALGATGLIGTVMVVTGTNRGEGSAAGVAGLVFMLLLGTVGVLLAVRMWRGRNAAVAVDAVGLWLDDGRARQVIPWQVLAGVGVYWSRLGRSNKLYSIELCPAGPVDERDPVLWALIRDEEPLRPGLPSMRYRVPLPKGSRDRVTAAVRRYVPPQLWFGEEQREPAYLGRPDRSRRPGG